MNNKRYFITRNSFGKKWGENGTCLISEDFILTDEVLELWMFFNELEDKMELINSKTEEDHKLIIEEYMENFP